MNVNEKVIIQRIEKMLKLTINEIKMLKLTKNEIRVTLASEARLAWIESSKACKPTPKPSKQSACGHKSRSQSLQGPLSTRVDLGLLLLSILSNIAPVIICHLPIG